MIDASVFKAYDVRGLYPSEITEGLFHQLGRAFVAYLGPGRYAVTRDMRVVDGLIAETEANISRGYAIEETVQVRKQFVDCGHNVFQSPGCS